MDEKGYVLSGVGMLLLIPIMIMIPIALSLQEEGSNIPTTFVKSDVVFRTFDNIRNDIKEKTMRLSDNLYNTTYKYDQAQLFAGNLTKLDNSISENIYKNAYADVVDSVEVKPGNYPRTFNMGNESGYIPLNNGVQVNYTYENMTTIKKDIIYKYRILITANVTIDVIKSNARHKEAYSISGSTIIFINTDTEDNATAASRINTFFNNLQSTLGG